MAQYFTRLLLNLLTHCASELHLYLLLPPSSLSTHLSHLLSVPDFHSRQIQLLISLPYLLILSVCLILFLVFPDPVFCLLALSVSLFFDSVSLLVSVCLSICTIHRLFPFLFFCFFFQLPSFLSLSF